MFRNVNWLGIEMMDNKVFSCVECWRVCFLAGTRGFAEIHDAVKLYPVKSDCVDNNKFSQWQRGEGMCL